MSRLDVPLSYYVSGDRIEVEAGGGMVVAEAHVGGERSEIHVYPAEARALAAALLHFAAEAER